MFRLVIKMKNPIKKLTAVLMALIIAVSAGIPVFAQEETEPVEEETVATLSLCSCVYLWPVSGHTWIYVENNSDKPIKVGHYEVPVGQGVSVGAFSFSVYDGWGIYYNIEAYKENTKGRMNKVWSISEELDAAELEKLTHSLINYPNYWGVVANCATFSFSMWDSVTGDDFFSLLIPAISEIMIILGGGKRGVLDMYCPSREQIFRQKGFGENAHLEPASDYSIS